MKLSHSMNTAIILASMAVAPQVMAVELVVNGSFEEGRIASGSYTINNAVTGWTRSTLANDGVASIGSGIEIQNNVAGAPAAGAGVQFAELDSDGVTKIFQDISTTAGSQYKLSFLFSPRPGVQSNIMNINWGSQQVDTLTAAGGATTSWTSHDYILTATGASTRLSFGNLSEKSDSYGSYVDMVSVQPVPVPAAVWLMGSGLLGLIGFGRRKA